MKIERRLSLVLLCSLLANGAMAQSASQSDDAMLQQLRSFNQQHGIRMTPEDEQRFLQQQRQLQERMKAVASMLNGASAAQLANPQNQGPSTAQKAALTEEALAAQLASLPKRPEKLSIEGRKDGFAVNGRGYVDPEGRIRHYAINPVSGLGAYLAETAPATLQIKVIVAGTAAEPVTIGTATRTGGNWAVETVTGKRMTGASLTVLAGGVLVARSDAAFIYTPGKGMRSIAVPQNYLAAQFQRGDVLGTEYLLLERDVNTAKRENGLGESLKSLGGIFGMKKQEDYALYNVSTGETVPLNIAEAGKRVGKYSNCHRRNSVVNDCANVDFAEALYEDGGRNLGHYFWRINWFQVPGGGVIAVAQENGLKEITIRDMKTGKKVIALNRSLGIGGFDAVQNGNGKVSIVAKMGFSTETVDDAAEFLAKAPAAGEGAAAAPKEEQANAAPQAN